MTESSGTKMDGGYDETDRIKQGKEKEYKKDKALSESEMQFLCEMLSAQLDSQYQVRVERVR